MRKLTVAKYSVENEPFVALAIPVICHEVSSPSHFFLPLNFFCGDHFTIKIKVAKKRLFEKVSLEH